MLVDSISDCEMKLVICQVIHGIFESTFLFALMKCCIAVWLIDRSLIFLWSCLNNIAVVLEEQGTTIGFYFCRPAVTMFHAVAITCSMIMALIDHFFIAHN